MKKLLIAVFMLLGTTGISFAQTGTPQKATVKKEETKKVTTEKTTTKVPLKKDGTPDKRYKASENLKKDGTPDKRYKENKKP